MQQAPLYRQAVGFPATQAMEETLRTIQQLLRPADTCIYVIQGCLLGLPSQERRIFAIVRHEGTQEHALFFFQIKMYESPHKYCVDQLYAIKGSFEFSLQNNTAPNSCNVLLNTDQGTAVLLGFPLETHTAQFITHLHKCRHYFLNSPSFKSKSAFAWLQGYEACETGWDRFSKPGSSSSNNTSTSSSLSSDEGGAPLISLEDSGGPHNGAGGAGGGVSGGGASSGLGKPWVPPLALPETWPWSYIFTPNSDGSTDLARCESLIEDFDPLYQKEKKEKREEREEGEQGSTYTAGTAPLPPPPPPPHPLPPSDGSQTDSEVTVSIQVPTPQNSPLPITGNTSSIPFVNPSPTHATSHSSTFPPSPSHSRPPPSPSPPPSSSSSMGSDQMGLHQMRRHCVSDPNLLELDEREKASGMMGGGGGGGGGEGQGRRRSSSKGPRGHVSHGSPITRSQEDLTLFVDGSGRRRGSKNDSSDDTDGLGLGLSLGGASNHLDYHLHGRGQSPSPPSGRRQRSRSRSKERAKKLRSRSELEDTVIHPLIGQGLSVRPQSIDTSGSRGSLIGGSVDELDYKERRTRSRHIPVSPEMRKHALMKSGVGVGVEPGRSHSWRKKRSPSPSPVTQRGSWVCRLRPGVLMLKGSYRESAIQTELKSREKEFCSYKNLRLFCGTWNVNGRLPPSSMAEFLLDCYVESEGPIPPDVYVIGFQELDLSPQCLMGQESPREEPWIECVEFTLKGLGNYKRICSVRLVGMFLLVYVTESLKSDVSEVDTHQVTTGVLGLLGNKGAVAVHMNIFHSSFCFVNSHFAAGMDELAKRNQDYSTIIETMAFTKMTEFSYTILDHDVVVWLGDLNYRIETTPEVTNDMIKSLANNYQIKKLLGMDQLHNEYSRGNVFNGFVEGPISFKPTYKYDPDTDNWDTSEKSRTPAYCDRIFFKGRDLLEKAYVSHKAMRISDHKPVSALFDTVVRIVIPEKEREVVEGITWRLDKVENDTLPQVDLSSKEFEFKDMKFQESRTQRLLVTNTGSRPVKVSFIPKLDEAICKPWMEIKPYQAFIPPLGMATIQLTVLVDTKASVQHTSGKEQLLEDILVLHLDGGKDFFISVSGNYLQSCFGSSLETLVNLHTYIREVAVGDLLDMSSSWVSVSSLSLKDSTRNSNPPPLDVPKELYALVNHLRKDAMDAENLFTEGGLKSEFDEIRDALDTGSRHLPGSVWSVADTLLTFLRALQDPVIPFRLHHKCMECCNNQTLCRQILKELPKVNCKVFVFMVTFMKQLLENSEKNSLEPKILATIFADVLLATPPSEEASKGKKALSVMRRKKATFLYQFLVHNITVSFYS